MRPGPMNLDKRIDKARRSTLAPLLSMPNPHHGKKIEVATTTKKLKNQKEDSTMKKLNSRQRKALELYFTRRLPMLRAELELGSTGVIGKFAEGLRIILNERPTDVLRCRAANRADIRIGRNLPIEVKTGCGAVGYAEDTELGCFTKEDMTAENVMLGSREIIWMPFPTMTPRQVVDLPDPEAVQLLLETVLKNAWCFTRQEFISLLEVMGKKGLASSLHITKHGYQLNIQTISPAMEARFWDFVDGKPTAYEELL